MESQDCESVIRIHIPARTRGEKEEMLSLERIIFSPEYYEIYKSNNLKIHGLIEKIKNKYNLK